MLKGRPAAGIPDGRSPPRRRAQRTHHLRTGEIIIWPEMSRDKPGLLTQAREMMIHGEVEKGRNFEIMPFATSLKTKDERVNFEPGVNLKWGISSDLTLDAGTDYTVVAVGQLASIEPLVLVDNNSAPAAGKAHVRFVHASPDAPAVDIAVTGGPVLFANVPFKGVGDYLPVDAGTYDLEARVAGTETVALSVPGVSLAEGGVYTIFAMGLVEGEPALTAVPSLDASSPTVLPETGGESLMGFYLVAILGLGLALVVGGLVLRSRAAHVVAK